MQNQHRWKAPDELPQRSRFFPVCSLFFKEAIRFQFIISVFVLLTHFLSVLPAQSMEYDGRDAFDQWYQGTLPFIATSVSSNDIAVPSCASHRQFDTRHLCSCCFDLIGLFTCCFDLIGLFTCGSLLSLQEQLCYVSLDFDADMWIARYYSFEVAGVMCAI